MPTDPLARRKAAEACRHCTKAFTCNDEFGRDSRFTLNACVLMLGDESCPGQEPRDGEPDALEPKPT